MTLISDLTQLKADLHSIPVDLGLPQYRDLVIRKSVLPEGSTSAEFKDFLLLPKLHIVNVPTRYVGLELSRGTVVVKVDDLFCKNLPRLFDKAFLEQDVEFYIVDPSFNDSGQVIDGIRCQLLDVMDKRSLSWQLILTEMPDNEPIQPVPIQSIASSSEVELD